MPKPSKQYVIIEANVSQPGHASGAQEAGHPVHPSMETPLPDGAIYEKKKQIQLPAQPDPTRPEPKTIPSIRPEIPVAPKMSRDEAD
jgi:hypothetical protein